MDVYGCGIHIQYVGNSSQPFCNVCVKKIKHCCDNFASGQKENVGHEI